MIKNTLAALALILGLYFTTPAQKPETWQSFTSPEGKFTVLVPTKPQIDVRAVDSTQGKLTLYTYSSSTKIAFFMASYGDYVVEAKDKAQIENILDEVRNGALKGLKAELLTEKSVPLNGFSGREFVGKGNGEQNIEVIFNWKMVLVGRRLYQLGVATTQADSNSPEIMKFFRSFELNN